MSGDSFDLTGALPATAGRADSERRRTAAIAVFMAWLPFRVCPASSGAHLNAAATGLSVSFQPRGQYVASR